MSYTRLAIQQLLIDTITHHADVNDVISVLKSGADPNGAVNKGLRPLHYAAHEYRVDFMETLISWGADVNLPDDLGYTALHISAKQGHYKAIDLLMKHGAVVNYIDDNDVDKNSQTLAYLSVHPLNSALENNYPDCAELLLKNGCNPNQKYFLGYEINLVPLENLECLKVLLKYGADVNAVSRGGLTTLMKACRNKNFLAAELLLKNKADVNQQCPPRFDQKQALHVAAMAGDVDICYLLLEYGAKTCRPPNYKLSPLEVAITHDRLAICKVLLEYGADPNELNCEQCSPLQVVCSTSSLTFQFDIIKVLLQNGAKPLHFSPTPSFNSPFLMSLPEYISSMDKYDIKIVILLLNYGAFVNFTTPTKLFKIQDPAGILPHVSKLLAQEDILELLLQSTVKIDLETIATDTTVPKPIRDILLTDNRRAKTLKELCRRLIRRNLPLPISKSAISLPIPDLIVKYLTYETQSY